MGIGALLSVNPAESPSANTISPARPLALLARGGYVFRPMNASPGRPAWSKNGPFRLRCHPSPNRLFCLKSCHPIAPLRWRGSHNTCGGKAREATGKPSRSNTFISALRPKVTPRRPTWRTVSQSPARDHPDQEKFLCTAAVFWWSFSAIRLGLESTRRTLQLDRLKFDRFDRFPHRPR